jgi:hypothetical protein
MRGWAYAASSDADVLVVKFEDLVANPFKGFWKIFDHGNLYVPEEILKGVLEDHSRKKMRKRDLERRENEDVSHYRKVSSDWRKELNAYHLDLFYQITGDLVDLLGYDR